MTNKELRKLNRSELMELLLLQSKQADEREKELEELRAQLEKRKLEVEHTGSIAEAAMQVNHVFEAAQAAADQYLESLDSTEAECERIRSRTKAECDEMKRKAQERSDAINKECDELERETRKRCAAMLKEAEKEAGRYWKEVKEKFEEYINSHEELKTLLPDRREEK